MKSAVFLLIAQRIRGIIKEKTTEAIMEFRELLYKRRSIRSFTGEKMTRSQLGYILEAATRAPSACNYQSWHFTVVVGTKTSQSCVRRCTAASGSGMRPL